MKITIKIRLVKITVRLLKITDMHNAVHACITIPSTG